MRISKFMSLVLRHDPAKAGLALEPGGWIPIDDLLAGAARAGCRFSRDELEQVLAACDKQRFGLDETATKVRANQGHSTDVEMNFQPAEPPAQLFHGTADRNLAAVLRDGLSKMARQHVHLSLDTQTATKVGSRHGKPVLLVVDAAKMRADGHVFFCSANGVWLVEHVPPEYLRVL